GGAVAMWSRVLFAGTRPRSARAVQIVCHEPVLRREARARVCYEYQPVGLVNGALGLRAHLRLDDARGLEQAARIDDHVGERAEAPEAVLPVARQSRHVRDDGVTRTGEHV